MASLCRGKPSTPPHTDPPFPPQGNHVLSLRAIAISAYTRQQPGLREQHVCFAALTQFSQSLETLSAHLSPPHPMAGLSVGHLWLKPTFLRVHALQADEAVSELASKYMILVSAALQRVCRSNLPNCTHSREGRSELEQARRKA